MKILKQYLREFTKKYAPELKGVKFKVDDSTDHFISFVSMNTVLAPTELIKEIDFFNPSIVLRASILHELGHIATYKGELQSFDDLVQCEAEAQKWAITRAINKRLNIVARCLIAEFEMWEQIDSGEATDTRECSIGKSYDFYNQGNPYSSARSQNNEWVKNIYKTFLKIEL